MENGVPRAQILSLGVFLHGEPEFYIEKGQKTNIKLKKLKNRKYQKNWSPGYAGTATNPPRGPIAEGGKNRRRREKSPKAGKIAEGGQNRRRRK